MKQNSPDNDAGRRCRGCLLTGGAARSRTGLVGFAIRYITALLPRQNFFNFLKKKGSYCFPFLDLEREKSLELSTSTLARLRSTN